MESAGAAERFRQLLSAKRRELAGELDRLESEGLLRAPGGELSSCDNHPADSGTETWDRSEELLQRLRAERELALVDAALARLDDGSFGRCLRCGGPVGEARLQVLPETPYCKVCSAALDAEKGGGGVALTAPRTPGAAIASGDAWDALAEYGPPDAGEEAAREGPELPDVEEPARRRS